MKSKKAFFVVSTLVLLAFAIACEPATSSSNEPDQPEIQQSTPTPTGPIERPAANLNLSINDFPSGWQVADTGEEDCGHQIRVMKIGSVVVLPEEIVSSCVKVFATAAEASEAFEVEQSDKGQTFRLEQPQIGDESYAYEGNATFELLFRKNNVLGRVQTFAQYGGSSRDTGQWAEKLHEKIR